MPPEPERLASEDDVAALGSDLRAEMADLRTEMVALRLSVTDAVHDAFRSQTRSLVFALVASVLLIALSNSLALLAVLAG